MHCCFSGDSEANPEDMILAAIQKGLDGLCFTDHFDYDYQNDPELFLLDFSSYKEKIFSLKEKYKDKCNIRWGIEIGLQPHIVQVNNDVTAKYPFDFVIGSSHVVHGIDPYYPHYYDGRSEDEAYLEYFESILENLTQMWILMFMVILIMLCAMVRTQINSILIRSFRMSLTKYYAL